MLVLVWVGGLQVLDIEPQLIVFTTNAFGGGFTTNRW